MRRSTAGEPGATTVAFCRQSSVRALRRGGGARRRRERVRSPPRASTARPVAGWRRRDSPAAAVEPLDDPAERRTHANVLQRHLARRRHLALVRARKPATSAGGASYSAAVVDFRRRWRRATSARAASRAPSDVSVALGARENTPRFTAARPGGPRAAADALRRRPAASAGEGVDVRRPRRAAARSRRRSA